MTVCYIALLFLSPKVKKENPNVKNIKARLYCAGSKSDTPLHTVKLDSVKFVIFPAIPADGTACWISVEVRHLVSSVTDPDPSDPYVFWPPGSGSISQRYGSGSFFHHAKIV